MPRSCTSGVARTVVPPAVNSASRSSPAKVGRSVLNCWYVASFSPGTGAGFLVGGAALYLATFGYTRWMMFRQVSRTRLTAAAVVLLVLPVALTAPALLTLALLAVVVAVLNVVEHRVVTARGQL